MAHIKELFTCLIRNEIGNFQGSNNSEEISIGSYSEIRRDQTRFNSQLEALCRTHFGPKYGIEFHGVDLIAILPPPELVDAFNSIQKATTAAVAMYNHAEAASKQKIMAEEGGLEISKVKAQAVALELRSLINGVLKLRQNHQFENYLEHKRQEILGNSRLTFIQDGELK